MLDTGLARPPSPTYTAITPVARAPKQDDPVAKTDLPAEETVRPSGETTDGQRSANNEHDVRKREDPIAPQMERRNIFDANSDSLVFVATNIETGHVVRQIPSETLLRLRAYTESVEKQQTEPPAKPTQLVV